MKIEIIKEISKREKCVAIVPKTVTQLLKEAQPAQEQNSHFPDTEYKQAGTDIIKDVQLLYSEAYITMKIFKMLTLH